MRKLVFFLLAAASLCAEEVVLYVSPDGADNAPATKNQPLASLEGAKKRLTKIAKNKNIDGAKIILRGGTYFFPKGVVFKKGELPSDLKIEITAQDSQKVVFHGGKIFGKSAFKKVDDKKILSRLPPEGVEGTLFEVDLKKLGITDVGKIVQRGFWFTKVTQGELFINRDPAKIARYPNGDSFLEIGEVYQNGWYNGNRDVSKFKILCDSSRLNRWANTELYLDGRFNYGTYDAVIKVFKFDPKTGYVETQCPPFGIFPGAQAMKKIKDAPWGWTISQYARGWAAYNILEEIDANFEYFIDNNLKLYVMLESADIVERAEISLLAEPILKIDGVQMQIRGIDFECTRGKGVEFDNVMSLVIDACNFRNTGLEAVSNADWIIEKDTGYDNRRRQSIAFNAGNVTIQNSRFINTGAGGVLIGGGNKRTLTHSNNVIRNCRFKRNSRINRSYAPAVWVAGFGATIENNTMTDNDHELIAFNASEVKIRRNILGDSCKLGMDAGTIYTGRNTYERGNVIEENLFMPMSPAINHNNYSVYVDDCSCGVLIKRNIFCSSSSTDSATISLNKGTDNAVADNVFIDIKQPLVEWIPVDGNKRVFTAVEKDARKYLGDDVIALYNKRYPETIDVLNRPYLNVFEGNKCFNIKKLSTSFQKDINGTSKVTSTHGKNIVKEIPEAKNVKNWTLKKIEKFFGQDALVKELCSLKFGASIPEE